MSDPRYGVSLERAVLGLLLLEPSLASRAERELTVEDFDDERHGRIFEAVCMLARTGRDAGPGGIGLELARTGRWGPDDDTYLAALLAEPGASDPRAFPERAKALAEESRRRKAEAILLKAARDARDRGADLAETLGGLRREVGSIESAAGLEELPPISVAADELLAILETGVDPGTPTGLPNLDEAIQGGIKPTQLVVIAGNTGSGKTSLATQIALLSAQWASKKPAERGWVLYFSLEMSALELVTRSVSQVTDITDGYRPPNGFSNRDRPRAREAIRKIRELPIRVEVPRQATIGAIRASIERFLGEHGTPCLVVVDHIGLLHEPKVKGGRTEEVSAITRSLKEMAMQLNVPVLALSQLNREVGKRDDHRPQLTDLRESGCLTGDTLVFLPDEGVSVPIKDLMGRVGTRVMALDDDEWKLRPRPIVAAFEREPEPVFRMRTRLGREIRATANHKFRTLSGWHRLDHLAVGRKIALPRALPSPEKATMSDTELALLGHLIGDGCTIPSHPIQYTTRERDLAEIVSGLANELFAKDGIEPRISAERTWYQVFLTRPGYGHRGSRNPLRLWLDELGAFGLRSYEKRIPAKVFAQPRASIALFLRHLWATDGCLRAEGVYPAIYYATSSRGLADDVAALLLRLGINAKIRAVSQKDRGRTQYHVFVQGRDEALAFVREVSAVGERRLATAAAIETCLMDKEARTNRDVIPLEVWDEIVQPVMMAVGMTRTDVKARIGSKHVGSRGASMSRAQADKVAGAIGSVDLALLANSDVYWDEIVSIEPDGIEPVYDLTVEEHHSFVANGMIPANSIEQDSNVVMLVHRPSYYLKDLEERKRLEEQGSEAFVYIAKNRSGPTAEVRFEWIGPRYLFRIPQDYFERTGMEDDYGLIESPTRRGPEGEDTTVAPMDLDLGSIVAKPADDEEGPAPTRSAPPPVEDDPEADLFA